MGLPPYLPDPAVRLPPATQRRLHHAPEDWPHSLIKAIARPGVDVDGVEHRPPNVVLPLPVGGVADANRSGTLVAVKMIEGLLGEIRFAVQAIHDLQLRVALGKVGDEPEVVVRLPVEAKAVETPQGERRVAKPAVPVVPVALATGGLRKRGRGGGGEGSGRRVRQRLEGERAALQVASPGMVGELTARQPMLPVMRGPGESLMGLLGVRRRLGARPGEGAKALLSLFHAGSGGGGGALEAEAQIGGEQQLQVEAVGRRPPLVIAAVGVHPARRTPPVVEDGLAFQLELNLAVDAAHSAEQHVFGGVVVGSPPVGSPRPRPFVLPGADDQDVANDHPARAGAPAGLQDHGAGEVAAGIGDQELRGPESEPAGVAVEHGPEYRGRVQPWQAEPLHRAAGRHQCRRLAIREQSVISDRGKS